MRRRATGGKSKSVSAESDPLEDIRILIDGVDYAYGRRVAVENVDWEIESPGVIGLLGPNGAGKSTLIRLLATIMRPKTGAIIVSGVNLEDLSFRRAFREKLGYLPQEFGHWPMFTSLECVTYVSWLRRMPERESRKAAQDALEAAGATDLAELRMRTLSGGQKRRVGLAQAIVNRPRILLLDEPTAGLDPEQRLRCRQLMRQMGSEGIVLVSTHLVEDVATACDRVAVMRGGRIVYQGSPAELRARAQGREDPEASEIERGYLAVLNAAG